MEFSTSQGTFSLLLQGLLPETNLHIPESIHFGLSAVHEAAELSFEIRNLRYEAYYVFELWNMIHDISIVSSDRRSSHLTWKTALSPRVDQINTSCHCISSDATLNYVSWRKSRRWAPPTRYT